MAAVVDRAALTHSRYYQNGPAGPEGGVRESAWWWTQ